MRKQRNKRGRIIVLTTLWSCVAVVALCIIQSIVSDIYITSIPEPFTRAERLWCIRKANALTYSLEHPSTQHDAWKAETLAAQRVCKGKNAPEIEQAFQTLLRLGTDHARAHTHTLAAQEVLNNLHTHTMPALAHSLP